MTPILGSLSLTERLFWSGLRHPWTRPLATRAVRNATRLLALALGDALREFRENDAPLLRAHAVAEEHLVLARLLAEVLDILGARLDKLPDRRRPHYNPHQRWRILVLKQLLALSAAEAARLFRISEGTVLRWETEAGRDPDTSTVGSLLRPTPPLRRYADVVRHVVQTLDRLRAGGSAKIAQILARAGWTLARETVRRYRHQPPVVPPSPRARRPAQRRLAALLAHHPHHLWVVDFTHVKGLFGLVRFRVAAVLDAWSRAPLALRIFLTEPKAADMAALVQVAERRHGKPRALVSDQGRQFTAQRFRRSLRRLRIPHRFGAVGAKGSIALVERFWRTLKDDLRLPLFRPLAPSDLDERLGYAVLHYTYYRHQQGLGARTPAEALYAWPAASARATHPPRAAPRQPAPPPPFRVDFLDPARRYPILVPAA